jgi:autotransporter-associated beta strand protein
VSGTTNALGSGGVTLYNPVNSLVFNATNDFTVTNLIDGTGLVVKLNTNTVTWDGSNPSFYGTVQVSNGVLRVKNPTAMDNAYVISLAGGTLDASLIGGLVLNNINQSMNCNGTVISNLTASVVNTLNFNLTPTTNDILNVTGKLTLNGNPTINLSLVGFKPAGVYRLINYSGTIQGGGSFTLVPPAGSSQTFQLNTSTPGQVNLSVSGVPRSLFWVGDNALNAWDTTTANWSGDTNIFSAGDNVTFNDSGSAFPNINVASTVFPKSMTVSNTSQAYVFESAGISTDGILVKRGANLLALANNGNAFSGPISIEAGTLSIGNGGATGSLGTGSITNNGELLFNMFTNGTTLTGVISGPGTVRVTGGSGSTALVLAGTNTYTGLTTVQANTELQIKNDSALGSPIAGTVVETGGSVKFTTLGNWTVAEPLTLNGAGATFPGALYVNTVSNKVTWTGPITLGSATRIRIVNDYVSMTLANTVTGSQTPLQCSTEGTGEVLSFLNALSIGNASQLTKDGIGTMVLAAPGNLAGSTVINGGTLLVNGQLNGGTVTVNTSGTIGGSGTIVGPVSVLNGASLAPGGAAVGTLTLNNSLSLGATAVTLMKLNRTNAQNADLLVAGSVPFAGSLTVLNVGPALQVGDTFNLFDGSLSGVFTTTNLPALASPTYQWDTSLLGSQGIIKVVSNSLPVLPLLITHIVRQATNVTLTWNSYPSLFYSVDYSLNLTNWATLKTNIPANSVTNSTTAAVDTTGSDSGFNSTLVQYQMGTADAQIQDATNTMAAGPLTAGSGVSLFNTSAATTPDYPTTPELQVTAINLGVDLATAVANQTWFTFQLTVGADITDLDLTSLSFNAARGGAGTPRGYGVYVTTPTTTDQLVQGATDVATARPTWSLQNISLAGISSLQNLTSGQVVTFTIPFYAPAAASSLEFDDITVTGNVTPGPQVPYAGAKKMFFRIQQQ